MDRTRHSGIYNIPSTMSVTLVGAGGIGAITAIGLAKTGINFMTVYDMDNVDEVNIPTQFHRVSDIGRNKAEAISDAVHTYSDEAITIWHEAPVDEHEKFEDQIVISAVDSITARQKIWTAVLNSPRVEWYLDARMGAQVFQLYSIPVHGMEDIITASKYDSFIKSVNEGDVPDVVCTEKATIFTALIAAGHICNAVKKIAMEETQPVLLYHNIKTNVIMELGL
jgi:molybdopterin/thiamine biosynthesis adenylyltransferase